MTRINARIQLAVARLSPMESTAALLAKAQARQLRLTVTAATQRVAETFRLNAHIEGLKEALSRLLPIMLRLNSPVIGTGPPALARSLHPHV